MSKAVEKDSLLEKLRSEYPKEKMCQRCKRKTLIQTLESRLLCEECEKIWKSIGIIK